MEAKPLRTRIVAMVLVGLFATLALNACESAPKWVKTGNYNDQAPKAFYGIGEVGSASV